MATHDLPGQILELLGSAGKAGLAAEDIEAHVKASRPTVNRALRQLIGQGQVLRSGASVSTRYHRPDLPMDGITPTEQAASQDRAPPSGLRFSRSANALLAELRAPLGARTPIGYQRSFVEGYRPNETYLLPQAVAEKLYAQGRSPDRQPAGTYARKVLEQLLIDLSWNSSRLEGNKFNLLDTKRLFERGHAEDGDRDATMLLNHKEAIEFMVDVVPEEGFTVSVIRNLHSVLMQGLLADETSVGAIRRRIVNIEQSVYTPTQMPDLIEEMLDQVVNKARQIKNPIEAAFFLWVQIAYLQPFEDGNKRTSRLSANLPLFLMNCAPLSFLDVEVQDYAYAMLGVYERNDTRMAAELFEWTYRRSIEKYQVVRAALGAPDPFRARYRARIGELVQRVVGGEGLDDALGAEDIPQVDTGAVREIVARELENLQTYNCARFHLAPGRVERWIAAGRPIIGRHAVVRGQPL